MKIVGLSLCSRKIEMHCELNFMNKFIWISEQKWCGNNKKLYKIEIEESVLAYFLQWVVLNLD